MARKTQADWAFDAESALREREANNAIRRDFANDLKQQKEYEDRIRRRQQFAGRHKNKAAANSIMVGDVWQVVIDVEKGRLTRDEAVAMAEDALSERFIGESAVLKIKDALGYGLQTD